VYQGYFYFFFGPPFFLPLLSVETSLLFEFFADFVGPFYVEHGRVVTVCFVSRLDLPHAAISILIRITRVSTAVDNLALGPFPVS